jgi:predicted ester cyclase
MSVEENLKAIDAAEDALNHHDFDRFETFLLNSVIQQGPGSPEPLKGRKAIRASLEAMTKAFPDIHMDRQHTFGSGDWVTQIGHLTGTHRGPLEAPGAPPIPPTNRPVRLPIAVVTRMEGGKAAEIQLFFDQLGLLTQLGVAPKPPGP